MLALRHRRREPELMDDPQLDPARHEAALRALARINWISASTRVLWNPLVRMAHRKQLDHLRVLDVATGSGDIPIDLYRKGLRRGLRLEILGLDISPHAVKLARRRAARHAPDVRFETFDVLACELPGGFDVVTCSLFLHHLDEGQAAKLLARMRRAAGQLGLVNDLVRGTANLIMVHVASRLLTRSDVVRVDASRSVRAAYTMSELQQLSANAGLTQASISHCWPCRMLLQWSAT